MHQEKKWDRREERKKSHTITRCLSIKCCPLQSRKSFDSLVKKKELLIKRSVKDFPQSSSLKETMCGGGWESFLTWLVHSSNSARFYESSISQDLEDKAVEIFRVSPRALSLHCWRLRPHQLLLRKSLRKYIRALCLLLGARSIVSPGPTDIQTDAQLQVKQSFQGAWKHNTKYFSTLL